MRILPYISALCVPTCFLKLSLNMEGNGIYTLKLEDSTVRLTILDRKCLRFFWFSVNRKIFHLKYFIDN